MLFSACTPETTTYFSLQNLLGEFSFELFIVCTALHNQNAYSYPTEEGSAVCSMRGKQLSIYVRDEETVKTSLYVKIITLSI